MSIRDHREGQPKTRNYVAQAAHIRRSEKDMGNKTGKGRSRKDQSTRTMVKTDLRNGVWA